MTRPSLSLSRWHPRHYSKRPSQGSEYWRFFLPAAGNKLTLRSLSFPNSANTTPGDSKGYVTILPGGFCKGFTAGVLVGHPLAAGDHRVGPEVAAHSHPRFNGRCQHRIHAPVSYHRASGGDRGDVRAADGAVCTAQL